MVSESEIVTLIQEAKKGEKERKFKESLRALHYSKRYRCEKRICI